MSNRLFLKIKRHLENNSKAANNFALQDKLLNDLPLSLRSQVIACTHGEIIERIHYFKNKHPDFLMSIMIELKPLRLSQGDILYHQKDHAEEIFFIQQGKIKLNIDVAPILRNRTAEQASDNESQVTVDQPEDLDSETEIMMQQKLVPFIAYTVGSYFGDCDLFPETLNGVPQANIERDSTAISDTESQFFVL